MGPGADVGLRQEWSQDVPSGVYFLSWGRRPPAGPRTRPPFHSSGSQGLLLQCHGSFLCPPCSSGRGSLGGVVISAGEESRERIHHSSRPETCLGFEYTHWGLSEKRGEPWTDAMEGPCCQRSASDSTQDRLGQPDSHRSSTDGNTDMTSIISQLKHEDKCYHQISGFFIFPILWFPALARVMGVLRKRESHTRAPWEQNSEVPDWSSPKCGAHTSAGSTNIS